MLLLIVPPKERVCSPNLLKKILLMVPELSVELKVPEADTFKLPFKFKTVAPEPLALFKLAKPPLILKSPKTLIIGGPKLFDTLKVPELTFKLPPIVIVGPLLVKLTIPEETLIFKSFSTKLTGVFNVVKIN